MNNSSADNNVTEFRNYYEIYAKHSSAIFIDQTVTPLFYVIGLPTNPLCAYIWLSRKTRANNSSAIYLGALSVSHVVFLLMHVLQELKYAWNIETYDGHASCEIFHMLFYIPQYLAPLVVLGFTVERYIAVCHPFAKARYCTVRRAAFVVVSLFVFCVLISSLQAYFWTYDAEQQSCNHRVQLQTGNFIELWTWFTELLLFGVAPLAALVFNVLVIREIRSLTNSGPAHLGTSGGSQASTVTLLSISFYLICTWLPYTIVYSLNRQFPMGDFNMSSEAISRDPTWQRNFLFHTIRVILIEITLSNSACYFFIYYATGTHFRDRVHDLLCPKRCIKGSNRHLETKQYIAVSKSSKINGTMITCV